MTRCCTVLALFVAACGGAHSELRLREVVLYQNGVGYYLRSGDTAEGKLRLSLRAHELDDALTTLTVVADEGDTELSPSAVIPRLTDGEDMAALQVDLGERRGPVRVAYTSQTSAWRASYRVVLPDEEGEGSALLQGWAVVDNTTAEDWDDIQLTLATAAPLSFAVDLRTPRRVERPTLDGFAPPPVATGPVVAEITEQRDRDSHGLLDPDDRRLDGSLDSDADGIQDVDDLCPEEGEAYNGIVDDDGCPDQARVVVRESFLRILESIYFEANSSTIPARGLPVVDAVAETLRGNPQLGRVDIAGHADSDEVGAWLVSGERAEAVRAALVARGVDPGRLRTRPFGATRPIEVGRSAQERTRNRRVAFDVTESPSPDERGVRADTLRRTLSGLPLPRQASVGSRYRVAATVTVPAGESAMVAMLNQALPGERILLFRPDPNVPESDIHPFRAARLRNNAGVDLVRGPVSLFAGGEFVGSGLLSDLAVGTQAFIPYALDLQTRVDGTVEEHRVPARIVAVEDGVVEVEHTRVRRTTYRVRAGARAPDRLYLRLARDPGYAPTDGPPRMETSAEALLVPVPLEAGETSTVTVEEQRTERGTVHLLRDLQVELRPFVDGGVPDGTDLPRLTALLQDRTALAGLLDRTDQFRVRLAEQAQRTAELRQSVEAVGTGSGQAAAIHRRLARQLEAAVADGEALALELATARAEAMEARADLREAIRNLRVEPR
ncbi:MAG: OmpA family protein [Myxococcota bacterium]